MDVSAWTCVCVCVCVCVRACEELLIRTWVLSGLGLKSKLCGWIDENKYGVMDGVFDAMRSHAGSTTTGQDLAFCRSLAPRRSVLLLVIACIFFCFFSCES